MILALQSFIEMSTAVFTSFLSLLSLILLAISLLIECSKTSSSDSDESTKEVEQKSSSSSSAAGSEKKSDASTPKVESQEAKQTKAPPPKTPAQSLRKEPVKPSQGPTVQKQKDGKNIEGKTIVKPAKKDEAFTVQEDALTNVIQAAKTTKLPPPKKENAPPSDPGDGNYEDVNLAQAAPEAPKRVVTVDPTAARFPTSGGKSTFTVLNTGTDRLVFKVKCSNNKDYRIKPVFGFLDPGGTHLVWVVRMPAAAKDDKMVIQWTVAPPNMVDGPTIFKAAKPLSVHSINVPLIGVDGDVTAQPSQAAPQGPGKASMVQV